MPIPISADITVESVSERDRRDRGAGTTCIRVRFSCRSFFFPFVVL